MTMQPRIEEILRTVNAIGNSFPAQILDHRTRAVLAMQFDGKHQLYALQTSRT